MHAGGQEFDPPRLHQRLRRSCKERSKINTTVVFNFDRFFAGIYDRHVILKFGNASSEKQIVLTNLVLVLVTLKPFPLIFTLEQNSFSQEYVVTSRHIVSTLFASKGKQQQF